MNLMSINQSINQSIKLVHTNAIEMLQNKIIRRNTPHVSMYRGVKSILPSETGIGMKGVWAPPGYILIIKLLIRLVIRM